MALIHVRTILRLWRRDREGTEGFTQVDLPVSVNPETAIDWCNGDLAARVGALSDCRLSETEIEFRFYDQADPTGDLPTQLEASEHGSIFMLTTPDDRYVIDIPALLPGLYLAPDGIQIDQTQTDIADLIDLLLANDAAPVVNPFSVKLTSVSTAFKRFLLLEDDRPTG